MIPEDYGKYKLNRQELGQYFLKAYGALFICAYVFYGNLLLAMAAGLLSAAGLKSFREEQAERRRNELRVQFKDMLYSISSSMTSGRHLKEAIAESEEAVALINGRDSILAAEIRNMCRIIRETNCTAETALKDLALRSGVKEIADFTDVCVICQYTGGDLTEMISKAVLLLTQTIELQREKDVMLSQKKLESKILVMMPVAVTALINIAAPDYLEVMYTSVGGRIIMTIALAVDLISFMWSSKLIGARVQM